MGTQPAAPGLPLPSPAPGPRRATASSKPSLLQAKCSIIPVLIWGRGGSVFVHSLKLNMYRSLFFWDQAQFSGHEWGESQPRPGALRVCKGSSTWSMATLAPAPGMCLGSAAPPVLSPPPLTLGP